jgi:hypothetical protein
MAHPHQTPSPIPSPGPRPLLADSHNDEIRIISGSSNVALAEGIAKELGITLESVELSKFADGEINLHIKNNIRGSDIFLIQPTGPPNPNDNLMELLLMVHTLKLSSAKRITVVMPYYGYARQGGTCSHTRCLVLSSLPFPQIARPSRAFQSALLPSHSSLRPWVLIAC